MVCPNILDIWYNIYLVCLSVCLSVTFVHCAQTAEDVETISFACLSRVAVKFGLHRSTLSRGVPTAAAVPLPFKPGKLPPLWEPSPSHPILL